MQTETKTDALFRQLRKLAADMPDGAAFPSVRQIMSDFRLSQATVTAAFRRLLATGIVESFVGSGTVVRHRETQTSPKVMIFASRWPSRIIAESVGQLCAMCVDRGYQVEVKYLDQEDQLRQQMDAAEADAFVIDRFSGDLPTPDLVYHISRCCAPVVLCRMAARVENLRYVTGNNAAAGIAAANYLYQSGHRRVALLYSEPHFPAVEETANAFLLCARTNGCEATMLDCQTLSGESSTEKAYARMRQQLQAGALTFSALFVVSDESAVGALRALEEAGLRVPEDLGVVGFGNVATLQRPLTSLDVSRQSIARKVVDILQACFEKREVPPSHYELAPELVVRDTLLPYEQMSPDAPGRADALPFPPLSSSAPVAPAAPVARV